MAMFPKISVATHAHSLPNGMLCPPWVCVRRCLTCGKAGVPCGVIPAQAGAVQHGRDARILDHEAPGQLTGVSADAGAVVNDEVVAVLCVVVLGQAIAVVHSLVCAHKGTP